ncbi:hypothetical protein HA402_007202 [Bradysia odoriphaga]|nr:hypothetical protein HA402_007202 [Bradysia odoriphaga]
MDKQRVLLSRLLLIGNDNLDLPEPLFYYIAMGLTIGGVTALIASLIGWWAACLNTYCLLSIYFLIVLILLIAEFGICLTITMWPQCLGLNLDETVMVKALQGTYGVPGKEQLTAAMDLAQTVFKCCAMNNNINYDTSLWRLQEYGQRDWVVPLTCCHLANRHDSGSYLDPIPINLTVCQSLERHEYDKSRHTEGCLDKIDLWYRQQYFSFLCAALIVAIVEFVVLLSVILSCTKISNGKNTIKPQHPPNHTKLPENIYMENEQNSNSNSVPSNMEIRDHYIQPPDFYSSKSNSSFKPVSKYQYHISKSYLV